MFLHVSILFELTQNILIYLITILYRLAIAFLLFVEQPLELFFLWKINAERKSLVVTDHDPNENR